MRIAILLFNFRNIPPMIFFGNKAPMKISPRQRAHKKLSVLYYCSDSSLIFRFWFPFIHTYICRVHTCTKFGFLNYIYRFIYPCTKNPCMRLILIFIYIFNFRFRILLIYCMYYGWYLNINFHFTIRDDGLPVLSVCVLSAGGSVYYN